MLASTAVAQAEPVSDWYFTVTMTWTDWNFTDGGGLQANIPVDRSYITWGASENGGMDASYHAYAPDRSRSGLYFFATRNSQGNPATGFAKTDETTATNMLVHYNNAILSSFKTLTDAKFSVSVQVRERDSSDAMITLVDPSQKFNVWFLETLNQGANQGDIFATDFADITGTFDYNGYTYSYTFGDIGNTLNPLGSDCARVGAPASCNGFVTPENNDTILQFGLKITNVTPAVPEPETYAMLLAGLAVVGSVARRKARRS
jgi:hypothetical protein